MMFETEAFIGWQKRYAPSDKPIVRIVWFDASRSASEQLRAPVPENYKAGVIDETLGFLVGETADFYIVSDSYEGDTSSDVDYRSYRGVHNIPKAITLRIEVLCSAS